MGIKHKFYINLDTDWERRVKFLGYNYHRWDAVSRSEIPDEIDKKMISYYNYPRQSHLGRCGCFCSHMELYKYIIENQLNDVLIVEDDAVLFKSLPKKYPTDGLIYLGGFFANHKITDKTPVNIQSKNGINYLDPDYRIFMTMSIIIPTWHIAKVIVDNIEFKQRYRAIDVMLGNMAINRYYEWPACFVEEGSDSTIAKKNKKSNELFEWVSSKKLPKNLILDIT